MDKYKIIDNYLSISDYQLIWNTVKTAPFFAYEKYKDGTVEEASASSINRGAEQPVGMTSNLGTDLFPMKMYNAIQQRCYFNYYGPSEWAHFHTDDDDPESLTLIYYPCPTYPIDEGGCTELLIDDEIVGIRPLCNRALVFKANILHRATPYKTKARYTVAVKYCTPERFVVVNRPTINYGN